jgi:hypothetical protein
MKKVKDQTLKKIVAQEYLAKYDNWFKRQRSQSLTSAQQIQVQLRYDEELAMLDQQMHAEALDIWKAFAHLPDRARY